MKSLELTQEELRKIVAKSKAIDRGTFGILYKLDDDTLFKFNYKSFINDFEVVDNKIKIKKLGDISQSLEILKRYENCVNGKYIPRRTFEIINKKDNVKHTELTQGAVFVDDYCVGYLLNYHKDMVNLYKYWKKGNIAKKDRLTVYQSIEEAVNELVENGIYMRDLTMHNIMINPQTNQIQIVDFEDYNTDVRNDNPKYLIREINSQLKEMRELILGKEKIEENCFE